MIITGPASSLLAATNSGTMTWATNPVAGSKVIVVIWCSNLETITSVVDNGSTPTTFTQDAANTVAQGNVFIYRADNITLPSAGSYAVTVTGTGGHTVNGGGVAYLGVKWGGPTAHNGANGTSTSVATGNVTPLATGALFIAGFGDGSGLNPETITNTGSFFIQRFVQTNGVSFFPGASADLVQSGGPAAAGGSWTLGDSVGWAALVAVYEAASGAFGNPVNSWSATFSQPWAVGSGMNINLRHPQEPFQVPLSGHSLGFGNWLVAVVSWRQDSGAGGVLTYPTDMTVCDDFHNMWIPVKVSPPAGSGVNVNSNALPRSTSGVIRHAVWVAPAARGASANGWWGGPLNFQELNVYVCPSGYTSAICIQVYEIAAIGPWYSFDTSCVAQWNQVGAGTYDPGGLYGPTLPAGAFALTVYARDNSTWAQANTQTNWVSPNALLSTSNPTNHNSDLEQNVLFGVTGSSSNDFVMALSGGTGNVDLSILQVVIHGITDQVTFPYSQPTPTWPVMITEMGIGSKGASPPDQVIWTDFTGRNNSVKDSQIGRGGQFQLATLEAGTWNLALDNYDGSLNPSNIFSGYYSSFLNSTAWNFENGTLNGWAGVNGATLAVSQAWSYTGTHSAVLTPNGITVNGAAFLGHIPIPDDAIPYNFSAQCMSPQGYLSGLTWFVNWIDSANNTISSSSSPGTGAPLTPGVPSHVSSTMVAPSGAVQASVFLGYTSVTPTTQQVFIDQVGVSAGTDAPLMGCVDADVPIRLRTVWPYTPTPYSVLFSGYTDDIAQAQDPLLRTYMDVQAADVWSRLTAQMAAAGREEVLIEPDLSAYFPLADPAGTISPVNVAPMPSGFSMSVLPAAGGPGSQTTAFGTQTPQTMAGDSSAASFSATGLLAAEQTAGKGHFLFMATGEQSISQPYTIECWSNVTGPLASGVPTGPMIIMAAFRGESPVWRLQWVASGANVQLQMVDSANVTVNIGSPTPAATWAANQPYYMSFSWVPGSPNIWELISIGWGATTGAWDANTSGYFSGSNTFWPAFNGFEFMGNLTTGLCWNGNLWGIAFHDGGWTPPMRATSHWYTESQAAAPNSAGGVGDYDVSRMSRITGYAGFPVALAASLNTQLDDITAVSDTQGQVASSYFTNIASTTLALMAVDGPGSLIYRTRGDWYGSSYGQLQQPVALNNNPNFRGTTGWQVVSNCTVAPSSLYGYAGSPTSLVQNPSGGATPTFVTSGTGVNGFPVLPNTAYYGDFSVTVPGGTSSTAAMGINWYTASGTFIVSNTFASVAGPLNANTRYTTIGWAVTSPSTAAFGQLYCQLQGTPPAGQLAYWGLARLYDGRNQTIWSLGENVQYGEIPFYQPGTLTQDRSQFYNYAYLTQYGAGSTVNNTGTGTGATTSQSTSGIIVNAENAPSIALRGQNPYTASAYLDNTKYGPHYASGNYSIEDLGNWIVWTLGSPVQRTEKLPIYPLAVSRSTPNSMMLALQGEVGDLIQVARRPSNQTPTTLMRSYISQLQHTINFKKLTFETQLTISPNWLAQVLTLDQPAGILNGQNVLGV